MTTVGCVPECNTGLSAQQLDTPGILFLDKVCEYIRRIPTTNGLNSYSKSHICHQVDVTFNDLIRNKLSPTEVIAIFNANKNNLDVGLISAIVDHLTDKEFDATVVTLVKELLIIHHDKPNLVTFDQLLKILNLRLTTALAKELLLYLTEEEMLIILGRYPSILDKTNADADTREKYADIILEQDGTQYSKFQQTEERMLIAMRQLSTLKEPDRFQWLSRCLIDTIDQTDSIAMTALMYDYKLVHYIKIQTPAIANKSLELSAGLSFKYLRYQPTSLCEHAIALFPENIRYVISPTVPLYAHAVITDSKMWYWVPDDKKQDVIDYINNPDIQIKYNIIGYNTKELSEAVYE